MRQVVLVVESNDHAGRLFKSCLDQGGYYSMATNDARKALRLAHAWQPDLVMIDMHLADNAADWLIKNIKNNPDSNPRIILTLCDDLEKASALASQVDAILPKPLDCWHIASVIDDVLNKHACTGAIFELIAAPSRSMKQVSASSAA